MKSNDALFDFYTDPAYPHQNCRLAVIPQNIGDKDSLLRKIATQLRFPSHFGFNWDALDESLSDLSWVEEDSVCIWHSDIPLSSSPSEAQKYLSVLAGIVREPNTRVKISFPATIADDVKRLLLRP